jgi:STE24 endopeptidase
VARSRFGRLCLVVEVACCCLLTFGGGLQALHDFWSPRLDGLAYGVALILSVVADLGRGRPAADAVQAVRHRRALRLQPDDAKPCFSPTWLKQAVLGLVIGTPVLLAVLWLMEQMGRGGGSTSGCSGARSIC